MRTIDATLLANQAALDGKPCRSVVIGTSPNTVDVSNFVVAYDYEELPREAGLTIVLDNSGGEFSTLAGDYAYIAPGAPVELKRGLTVAGTDYLAELPRTWVEGLYYEELGGVSVCILGCIDWWGKLGRWRAASDQTWTATSATTILEWLLGQVGLTREAGSMTALSIDFAVRVRETGASAVKELMAKMPEYLHPGLDGEVKWREIDGAEAPAYTFGWNANHPVLLPEAGNVAWEVNTVTVKGRGSATGTAANAAQVALVGTRRWTIYDEHLTINAQCAQRAQAELDLFEAGAVEGQLVVRPCHGLELWDVVTLASPPWGGSNFVGRVQRFREEWNKDGRWFQVIGLGDVPGKDPGSQPAKAKRRKGRRSSRRVGGSNKPPSWAYTLPGLVPIGAIVAWSGAEADIPADWALCDGNNGTPDLRDRFLVGAGTGSKYGVGDMGGEDESDLAHAHGPGTLATDSDAHTHGAGTLVADSDAHTHGVGTLAAGNDGHNHELQPYYSGGGVAAGTDRSIQTDTDTHTHTLSGATASDSHSHDVSGSTGSDSHSHDVDSGETAEAGSGTQENRPLFYALCWIMRIA